MPTLASLLDAAGPENPLSPYVSAILDSGLIVTLRDGSGRFEATSPALAEVLGHPGHDHLALGQPFMGGQRFFDEHGRELTRSDHPAQIARRTGIPQRQRVLGIRTADGDEAWLLASFMPVRSTLDGWEVLSVGSVLGRSVFRPPTEAHETELPASEALLRFAIDVSGHRYVPSQLVAHLRPAASAIAPEPISLSLMLRDGDRLYPTPITRYGHHPLVESMGMSEEARGRWDSERTCYVPDLRPTDIVGDRVVVEYDDPVRSLALVPVWDGPRRVASLVAASPEPHALSPQQLAGLEALGRLAGPALQPQQVA